MGAIEGLSAAAVILLGVENSRPGGQLMSPGPQQQTWFRSSSSGQLCWWGLRHDEVLWSLGCPSFPEAPNSWNKGCASLISDSLSCGHLGSQRNKRLCSQSEGENPITYRNDGGLRKVQWHSDFPVSSNNSSLTWMQRCNGNIIPHLGL